MEVKLDGIAKGTIINFIVPEGVEEVRVHFGEKIVSVSTYGITSEIIKSKEFNRYLIEKANNNFKLWKIDGGLDDSLIALRKVILACLENSINLDDAYKKEFEVRIQEVIGIEPDSLHGMNKVSQKLGRPITRLIAELNLNIGFNKIIYGSRPAKLRIALNALVQIIKNQELVLKMSLNDLLSETDMSVRMYNCLKRDGINTVKELTNKTMSDLLKVRDMGRTNAIKLEQILNSMGLSLKQDEP